MPVTAHPAKFLLYELLQQEFLTANTKGLVKLIIVSQYASDWDVLLSRPDDGVVATVLDLKNDGFRDKISSKARYRTDRVHKTCQYQNFR